MARILFKGIALVIIPQRMYAGLDVFVLLSIPGFILAGNLMNAGGITERIVRFANALVGWMRGGLGQANIASALLFGTVSGTAVADAASIGGVMIPGMKRAGYPAPFAAAVTAASSTVGPMIPPSVPMIIVGAIPGQLLGVAMMVTCYVVSRRNNFPVRSWQGFAELGRAFASAIWAIAPFLICNRVVLMMVSFRLDVAPVIGRVLPLTEVAQAMALAVARDRVIKVQVACG